MTEIVYAAITGALISALRFFGKSKFKAFRVFVTGFFLALFIAEDVVALIQQLFNFEVSQGGIVFLVSFLGAEILERIILLINTVTINIRWTNKDDTC